MKHLYTIITLALLIITTGHVHAQDTCKIFSIKNPHGAAMSINRIWVVDTVNFRVEPMKATPFQLGATESFEVRICILARDGQRHSSQIRYTNTHGTTNYSFSMDAPTTSSVEFAESAAVATIAPHPLQGYGSIDFGRVVAGEMRLRIYSMVGELVLERMQPEFSGRQFLLDATSLIDGGYLMVATLDGRELMTRRVVVSR